MGWEKIVLPKFTEGSIDPQENSSFELFHFLKREVELAGKVEVIGLIKKKIVYVFSLGGRVDVSFHFCITLLYLSVLLYFWDLLAQDLSITFKTSRVPWGPFTDCPKIVSVSKPFRSQELLLTDALLNSPISVAPRVLSALPKISLSLPGPFHTH